jgi:hypothetical protein
MRRGRYFNAKPAKKVAKLIEPASPAAGQPNRRKPWRPLADLAVKFVIQTF